MSGEGPVAAEEEIAERTLAEAQEPSRGRLSSVRERGFAASSAPQARTVLFR